MLFDTLRAQKTGKSWRFHVDSRRIIKNHDTNRRSLALEAGKLAELCSGSAERSDNKFIRHFPASSAEWKNNGRKRWRSREKKKENYAFSQQSEDFGERENLWKNVWSRRDTRRRSFKFSSLHPHPLSSTFFISRYSSLSLTGFAATEQRRRRRRRSRRWKPATSRAFMCKRAPRCISSVLVHV